MHTYVTTCMVIIIILYQYYCIIVANTVTMWIYINSLNILHDGAREHLHYALLSK